MFVQLSIFGFFNDWMANFAQMPNGHIWIYVVLGAIIFIETGLVIFPSCLGIPFYFLLVLWQQCQTENYLLAY